MVGILLASRPDVARPPNEHRQAELLYKSTTGVIKVCIGLALFQADTRSSPPLHHLPANCSSMNFGAHAAPAMPRKASGGVPSLFLVLKSQLNETDVFALTDFAPTATVFAPDGE